MARASSAVTRIIFSLLSGIRFPCADDTAICASPCIHHNVNAAVYLTQTPDPGFTIIEPVIDPFNRLTIKQRKDIDEINVVILQIELALSFVPFERHDLM